MRVTTESVFDLLNLAEQTEKIQWRALINQELKGMTSLLKSPLNTKCLESIVHIKRLPTVGIYPFITFQKTLEADLLTVCRAVNHRSNWSIKTENREFEMAYWGLACTLAKSNPLFCRVLLGLPFPVINLIGRAGFDELKKRIFVSEIPQFFELLGRSFNTDKQKDPCLDALNNLLVSHVAEQEKHKERYKKLLLNCSNFSMNALPRAVKPSSKTQVTQMIAFCKKLNVSERCLSRFLELTGEDPKNAKLHARRVFRKVTKQETSLKTVTPNERKAIEPALRFYFCRAYSEEMSGAEIIMVFAYSVLLACRSQEISLNTNEEWGIWVSSIERYSSGAWKSWVGTAEHELNKPQRIGI